MTLQMIAFTNKLDQDVNNLTELYLPCPRSNRRSVYFFNDKGNLFEVQKVTGPGRKSAWLINSSIYKDGSVRFITPLDPLFMALPILLQVYQKDQMQFKSLDDIFSRENVKIEAVEPELEDEEGITADEYSKPIDVHRLTNISGFTQQLAHLCDTQEIAPGLFVYRLNESLAVNWLEKKVENLLLDASFRSNFEKTKQEQDSIKLEAAYTIANYLNRYWFDKLLDRLELTEPKEIVGDITAYATDSSPTAFFKRMHPDERMLDSSPTKKSKPAVPRSLAKVNTRGMKSITSFFAKKQ